MTNQLGHKNNLCGVGLRISQFNAQELATCGASLLAADNVHGGRVWVSRVILGGPAASNGLIQENDELLQIDGEEFDSVITAGNMLRGAPDSTVSLKFQTSCGGKFSVCLVRALSRANHMALNYLQREISVANQNPYKDLPVLASSMYNLQQAESMYGSQESQQLIGHFKYASNSAKENGTMNGHGGMDGSGRSANSGSNGMYSIAKSTEAEWQLQELASSFASVSSPHRMPGAITVPRMLKQGRHVCSCKDCGSHFGNAFAAP